MRAKTNAINRRRKVIWWTGLKTDLPNTFQVTNEVSRSFKEICNGQNGMNMVDYAAFLRVILFIVHYVRV